jgi:hypothetical protein
MGVGEMLRIGTSHFATISHAVTYYQRQGMWHKESRDTVKTKLNQGEIHIGKPEAKPGERVTLDSDGRYWIEETNPF